MFPDHFVYFLLQTWTYLISSKLISFSGKWYLETTVWVLEVFGALGLDLLSRPLPWIELKNGFILSSFLPFSKYQLLILCGSLDEKGFGGRMRVWLSPFTVHLKLLQHCQLTLPQYKIKSL